MDWKSIKAFFASLTIEKLLPFLLILIGGLLLVKLLMKLFDRALHRSKLDPTMFTIIRTIMRVLLIAIVLLIAASSLGIDVTSLVALLSVVSLAISLAVQNTLANVIGSITLLVNHPMHIGDYVEIGAESGTVEEIGMVYTRIVTPDGRRIYIPNSDAASARICNYSAEGKRRIDLVVTASYGDDTELVKKTLLAVAAQYDYLEGTQPEAYVTELSDSSVQYTLRVWVKESDYWPTRYAMLEAVKRAFDAAGISIPFPQMDVHLSR